MKSQKYWAKRFEMLEAAQMNKGINFYNRLATQYEKAAARVTKEINAFYARYATENKITMAEAKKQLRGRELKEFRWTVEEYIEKGETLNYSTKWAKELENASIRYRVTRLEALKLQMQQQVEMLMGNEVDELDTVARNIYEDGYYRTAFEIQKGLGVGSSFMRLNATKINKIIAAPYTADGLNFSQRIWGKHRPELIQKLNTELVQSIIRGEDPQKLINKIAKHFDVAKRQAGNLVMTESAFFSSASTRDSFNELDVEKFEVVATLDSHTSETCQELDGKVFPMSEYEIGVTAPPFHVNCRTTTCPYLEDEEPSYRAARDSEGNYIEVPSTMTYKEWKEKFLTPNTE